MLSQKLPLKTPSKIKAEAKLEQSEDDSFFEADDGQKFEMPTSTGDEWSSLPDSFRQFFGKFVTTVADMNAHMFGTSRDLRGLEKMNRLIGQDLESLDINLRVAREKIGGPIAVGGIEAPSVSAALDIVSERMTASEDRLDVIDMTLTDNLKESSEKFVQFNKANKQNWKRITPLLLQIKDVIRANLKHPISGLSERITKLEGLLSKNATTESIKLGNIKTTKKSNKSNYDLDDEFTELLESEDETTVESMPERATSRPTSNGNADTPHPSDVFERLRYLEDVVKTLQTRSLSDGVRVQHHSFQSKEEVKDWIELHLPGCRFGIFLDDVSIWEYFSQNHQNMTDVMNTYRDTARIGFATIHEGKVATSFQNVLPAILGKGSDLYLYLPGLPNHKKWNADNGSSGLRFHLTHELPGVNVQVLNNIENSVTDHYSPARNLAIECLQRSIQFMSELSNYITKFYDELKSSGSFTEEQCWHLVSRCTKRCFQDMASVRVTARDVEHAKDRVPTATEFIWATLKTHGVMEEYIQHNFEDHPSFASVITRFVTNNSFQTDVRDIVSRMDKTEKDLKALSKRVDTAYNKINKLEMDE